MGFTNPIASAEGALVREAVKSPNYPPDGWSINRDGSAEFASGTFRGEARFVQPARKRRRANDALNLAAGKWVSGGLGVEDFATGNPPPDVHPVGANATVNGLIAPRRAIYNLAAAVQVDPNASGGEAILTLYRTMGAPDANGTNATNVGGLGKLPLPAPATGGGHFTCSAPVLLELDERAYAVIEFTVNCNIVSGHRTWLALAYSSEAP